jgi:D-3-phosphoglycerate dehydrogenase / 2-oxoglutarate reductase
VTGLSIKPTHQRFHAALIAFDEPFNPPEGLKEEFHRGGLDFTTTNCHTEDEVIDLARGKDLLLTSSARKLLTRRVIDQLTTCRAVIRVGSGTDCIDIVAATEHGIMVVNTPNPLAEEVSEHTAALLLDCIRRITFYNSLVKQGGWRPDVLPPMRRIRGKTLGFIGFGRIARSLAAKLSGFKLRYLAYDPYLDPNTAREASAELVDLDELLARADFVSMHAQLTPETQQMIGERELRLMQQHSIFVNTARGGLVDQKALYRALTEGWIAGAGLDVLVLEPPGANESLLQLENVVLTPHVASWSDELMGALFSAGCQVAIELSSGQWPATVVNPQVKPWWGNNA